MKTYVKPKVRLIIDKDAQLFINQIVKIDDNIGVLACVKKNSVALCCGENKYKCLYPRKGIQLV